VTKILLSMVPLATSKREETDTCNSSCPADFHTIFSRNVDAKWSASLKLNRHRLQNRVSTAETTDLTGRHEAALWRGSAEDVERNMEEADCVGIRMLTVIGCHSSKALLEVALHS